MHSFSILNLYILFPCCISAFIFLCSFDFYCFHYYFSVFEQLRYTVLRYIVTSLLSTNDDNLNNASSPSAAMRFRLLKHTRLNVVAFLNELPKTQHDIASFNVDVNTYTVSSTSSDGPAHLALTRHCVALPNFWRSTTMNVHICHPHPRHNLNWEWGGRSLVCLRWPNWQLYLIYLQPNTQRNHFYKECIKKSTRTVIRLCNQTFNGCEMSDN